MREQSSQGNRLGIGFWNREIKVLVYVAVEVELALLDQLHHCRRGKQFRDRARTKQCLISQHWFLRGDIGVAVTFCEKHLTVLNNRDDGTGDVSVLQLRRNQCVQKGFEVLPRECGSGTWLRRDR